MKINSKIKGKLNIFKWALVGVIGLVVMVLALIYVLPDYDMYVVQSDSMTPVFSAGDLVVTAAPGAFLSRPIAVGTVVTYDGGDILVTHRVVAMEGDILSTKGDASEDADLKPVSISQVRGTYLFHMPYVGFLNAFMRTKLGWFLVIIVPALSLLIWIITDIFKEALRKEKKNRAALADKADGPLPESKPAATGD